MMYQIGNKLVEITPEGALKFSGVPDKRYFESWTIDDYTRNTEFNIQYDREELVKLEDQYRKLKELSLQNDNIVLLTSKYNNIEEARQNITWDIKDKAKKIEKTKLKIEKARNSSRLLKEYRDKGPNYIVVFTNIDHWGSSHVERAIEDSGAVILSKVVD